MSAFLIDECAIIARDTEPKCIGELPKVPIYETLNITLHFVGTGNTTNISSKYIVETIMQRLEIIEIK